MSKPISKNTSNNNIELNYHYYRNRRQLVLFSTILFVWEFIGIILPNKPFNNIKIEIIAPQAALYILIILIFYFL